MTSPDLPAGLKAALAQRMQGVSQSDAARRAALQSQTYREGGSSTAIRTAQDAMAYALARMPATYAAVIASLAAIFEARPDFEPSTLLDVGAGPGTATWAVRASFSAMPGAILVDSNPALRDLALGLANDMSGETPKPDVLDYRLGDASVLLSETKPAALTIGSYFLNEIAMNARGGFADMLWDKTDDILLVVEPGTPSGYARIIDLRARLIAKGGHVIAPCPHDKACPLVAPDWCHFSQRLPRSRTHMQLKGAGVPFEDERFSYVALSRFAPDIRRSRVLAQPAVSKGGVIMKVCGPSTAERVTVPRQDRALYAHARKLRWGDTV